MPDHREERLMAFSAKVIADSIGPSGRRITTIVATYPRIIHSELLTHCALSRSSASSRAIPIEKMIQRVLEDPFIPDHIGKAQKGMQAEEELTGEAREKAIKMWLSARDSAVEHARGMMALEVAKQVTNRLLEPWMWITVIFTATDWNNLWALRCHKAAEPHFQTIARMMRAAKEASVPLKLAAGEWHLPFIETEDRNAVWGLIDPSVRIHREPERAAHNALLVKIAVGRAARVSYLTHAGKRDIREDIALHDKLIVQDPPHAAPGEHVAQALATDERVGKLTGWRSYRMSLPNESVPG
jgi:hypothetical protein